MASAGGERLSVESVCPTRNTRNLLSNAGFLGIWRAIWDSDEELSGAIVLNLFGTVKNSLDPSRIDALVEKVVVPFRSP